MKISEIIGYSEVGLNNKSGLLSCPFCGSDGEVKKIHWPKNQGESPTEYTVQCCNESCHIQISSEFTLTKKDAINAWNTRKIKISVGTDEEALAVELENRLADDFHAETPQYFKTLAKSLSASKSKWLVLKKEGE